MTTNQADAQSAAARRLYDAEVALHIARQTGVDAWMRAAADRLHDAVEAHRQIIVQHSAAA
jgi:hypothetical protein